MKDSKIMIHVIAIILMILPGCGGGSQHGESRTSGTTGKKVALPNDPCELVFHVISTMNKGPETLDAAILNVNDFRQLKKDYPDLEKHYDLWVKHHHSINSDIFNFPLSRAMQMEFLERMAAKKNIQFADRFNKHLKEYYSMFREGAVSEGWIWDEIRLNDCMHRTNDYPKVDLVQIFQEDGSHENIDEDLYSLPDIGETTAYILINGEITQWEFITVKTKQGWRLFMPYLHWLRDEM